MTMREVILRRARKETRVWVVALVLILGYIIVHEWWHLT